MLKRAQIWIETTVYTLIGLALIGLVLTYATPKIASAQEKTVIEQTITSMEQLDSLISEIVNSGPGNQRTYQVQFKKGNFLVDGINNSFLFEIPEVTSPYSQVNTIIKKGPVSILTSKDQKKYRVLISLNYSSSLDLTVKDQNILKSFSPSPTQYKFIIFNNGTSLSNKVVIDVKDVT